MGALRRVGMDTFILSDGLRTKRLGFLPEPGPTWACYQLFYKGRQVPCGTHNDHPVPALEVFCFVHAVVKSFRVPKQACEERFRDLNCCSPPGVPASMHRTL